jgi:hypothetical protein
MTRYFYTQRRGPVMAGQNAYIIRDDVEFYAVTKSTDCFVTLQKVDTRIRRWITGEIVATPGTTVLGEPFRKRVLTGTRGTPAVNLVSHYLYAWDNVPIIVEGHSDAE